MKAPTVAINAICWWPQQLVSRQSAILSALYYSSSPLSVPEDLTKDKFHPASRSLVGTRRSRQKKLAPENSLKDSPPAAAFFTLYDCARNFLLQFLQQKKPSPFGSPTSSSASSLHQQSEQFWSEEAMQRENSQFPHQKKIQRRRRRRRRPMRKYAPSHKPRARNEEDEDSVFHIPR